MREIILDTETTGLNANGGDRVVEIGAVEVLNAIPTGNTFHVYINPERDMPDEAFRVHGLSAEFLADKKKFAEIAADFAAFLGSDKLVAHNATFDVGFLNAELARCNLPTIGQHQVVDTLQIARRKHGGSNSLDALCSRYGVDASRRTKHGALLDAELLAEVYLELTGGRQATFVLGADAARRSSGGFAVSHPPRPVPLTPRLTDAEREAHAVFMATFKFSLWKDLAEPEVTPRLAAE